MKNTLSAIKCENKEIHLFGDYNINILNSHLPTSDFLAVMYSNFFIPLINRPTRVKEGSATIIDNIFTNCVSDKDLYSGILFCDISDHFPVFTICNSKEYDKISDEFLYKRVFSPRNIEQFKMKLSSIDWSLVLDIDNA